MKLTRSSSCVCAGIAAIVACTERSLVEEATGSGTSTSPGGASDGVSTAGTAGTSAGPPTLPSSSGDETTTGGDGSSGTTPADTDTTTGGAQPCGEVVLSNGIRFACLSLPDVSGYQLATADFDGDGVDDLAVADFGPLWMEEKPMHLVFGGVTPARAGGFGFFATSSDNKLLAGDFDGDGDGDLVIASFGAVQGFWNDGVGGFVSSGEVFLGQWLWSYAAADVGATGQARLVGVTRDQPPELRVVGFDADHKSVLFPESAPVAECLIEVTVAARLDGDEFPEIVAAPYCDPPMDATPLRVYRGTPTPQFLLVEPGVPTGSGPGALAAGDFDGDGHTDIAVGNQWIDNVMVLRGDGLGGLVAQTTTPTCVLCTPLVLERARLGATGDSMFMTVVDANVLTNFLAVILEPLGAPMIEVIKTDLLPYVGPAGMAVGDFNGDGTDDVAYIRGDESLELLLSVP